MRQCQSLTSRVLLLCGVPSMNWQVPQIAGKEKVKSPLAGNNFQGEDCGWLVRRGLHGRGTRACQSFLNTVDHACSGP